MGSLFSGIGGLELGLEWAGLGPTVWQVERDPYCRAVLRRHWPDATRFDDVRTVGAAVLAPVDGICGGFPCQDISGANPHGKGLDGERSGLWFEFRRIVEGLRPRWVVVENVGRLARRGLDVVASGLHDLGYEVEATRLLAADVGAPHLRERCFIVGILAVVDGGGLAAPVGGGARMADANGAGGLAARAARDRTAPTGSGDGREGMARPDREGQPQPGGPVGAERGWLVDSGVGVALGDPDCPRHALVSGSGGGERNERAPAHGAGLQGAAAEPRVGRVPDGLPWWVDGSGPDGAWPHPRGVAGAAWEPPRTQAKVPWRPHRLRALGNAVVPQCAYVVGLRVRERLDHIARCA